MHLIIILVVVLIIFGPGKLPEIGEGLAKSIKSFKKMMKDDEKVSPTEKKDEKV
jgi:sec-independent protein translocase protein TatA